MNLSHVGTQRVLHWLRRYTVLQYLLCVLLGAGALGVYLLSRSPVVPVRERQAKGTTSPVQAPIQGVPGLGLGQAPKQKSVLDLEQENKALKEQTQTTQQQVDKLARQLTQKEQTEKQREEVLRRDMENALHVKLQEQGKVTQETIRKAMQDVVASQRAAQASQTRSASTPVSTRSEEGLTKLLRQQVDQARDRLPLDDRQKPKSMIRTKDAASLQGTPPPLNRTDTPYLPMGSFAPARVISGVAATDRAGKALPVVFSIVGPFRPPYQLHGPGRDSTPTQVPLHGCFVLGKAQGDMATGRANVELEWLSCVMPNLMTYEREIEGFATAIDHRFGLYGKVEVHEAAYLAKVFLTSLLAGAAQAAALARQSVIVTPFGGTVQTTTGDVGQTMGFSALATGATQLSQYYLEQARKLTPIIIVDADTPCLVWLQKPVILEDFPTRMLVALR